MDWNKASAISEILASIAILVTKIRLGYFLVTHLRMRENNWLQYKNGILDEETWRSYRTSLGVIFAGRQPRKWWSNRGVERLFNAAFVADVNALIGDLPVVESSPQLRAFD